MGPFSNDPLRASYEKYNQADFMAQNPELFSQETPTEDVGFLEGLKNKVGDVWSGITGSKAGQAFNKFAITPMMMLANRYNALNPNAVNF